MTPTILLSIIFIGVCVGESVQSVLHIGILVDSAYETEWNISSNFAKHWPDILSTIHSITKQWDDPQIIYTLKMYSFMEDCALLANGTNLLISLTSCSDSLLTDGLASRYHIPHIAIPQPSCQQRDLAIFSEMTLVLQVDPTAAVKTLIYALDHVRAKRVAYLYDSFTTDIDVQIARALSDSSDRGLNAFQLTTFNIASSDKMTEVLELLKRGPKNGQLKTTYMILRLQSKLLDVIREAQTLNMMTQKYFWIILNTNLTTHKLVNDFNLTDVNPRPNIAVFSQLSVQQARDCPSNYIQQDHRFLLKFFNCQLDNQPEAVTKLYIAMYLSVVAFTNISHRRILAPLLNVSCHNSQGYDYGEEFSRQIHNIARVEGLKNSVWLHNTETTFDNSFKINFVPSLHYDTVSQIYSRHNKRIFPNTFYNFFNRTLIVTTKFVDPFSFKGNRTTDGYEINARGMSIDMLNEMVRRLNFNYKIKEPEDSKWGAPNPNGTWNGMVGYVMRNEIDFGIGPFTITEIRERVIDFTIPYMEDGNALLIRVPKETNRMFRFLTPFHWITWLSVIGGILFTGGFVFLYSYLSPLSAWNLNLNDAINDEISLLENYWSLVGCLLEQGQDFYPYAHSSRVVTGIWWLFTVVILASYTGDMTAYLSLHIHEETIKRLEDLPLQTKIKPIVKDSTNAYSLFKLAGEGTLYNQVWKMMDGMPVFTEAPQGVELVQNGDTHYAFVGDSNELKYSALQNCKEIMVLPALFNVAGFGWVLATDSYYLEAFNFHIEQMKSSGLIQRWINKWWRSDHICTEITTKTDALDLESVSGAFLIMVGLYLIGTVLLCIELLLGRYQKRKSVPIIPNNAIVNDSHLNF